jgi:hypothetical protein
MRFAFLGLAKLASNVWLVVRVVGPDEAGWRWFCRLPLKSASYRGRGVPHVKAGPQDGFRAALFYGAERSETILRRPA